MRKKKKIVKSKTGLSPGSAVYTGEHKRDEVSISIIDYDADAHEVKTTISVEELAAYRNPPTTTWINICGLHDTSILQKVADIFNIHALILEDILSTQQRPKIETFEEQVFIVLRMMSYLDDDIYSEQISIVFGPNYVITFQESEYDIFDLLRKRLENGGSRLRQNKSDYLTYAIMDIVIDNYFVILEQIGEQLEEMEDSVLAKPDESFLQTFYHLRRKLIYLRKSTWPLREVVGQLQRGELALVHEYTLRFLGDLYDHTIRVIDSIETYREMAASILDIYLSTMSNRMNEVMKILTIISTIFIPLSFLAGVYGMNFDTSASAFNLPELGMRYGYPVFWMITLAIAGSLLYFFRRKRWL